MGIDEQRVQVLLRLTGDAKGRQGLGHGYRVVARITLMTVPEALSIPVGALFRDGSDWATFVVKDGTADLRRIALGERDDEFAQVVQGLAAGEEVILHPNDLVSAGVSVTARPGP